MSKIKVGDTVIIRKPKKRKKWPYWLLGMDKLNNKKVTINGITHLYNKKIFVFDGWDISLDWCKKVNEKKQKLKERIKILENQVAKNLICIEELMYFKKEMEGKRDDEI